MKLSNINIGDIFANFISLCEKLEVQVSKGGSMRKNQQAEFKRHFNWNTEGRKIIITEIYNKPKEKIDGRVDNGKHPNSRGHNSIYTKNIDQINKNYIMNRRAQLIEQRVYNEDEIDEDDYLHFSLGVYSNISWLTSSDILPSSYSYIRNDRNKFFEGLQSKYKINNRMANADSIDYLYRVSSSANKSSLKRLHRQKYIELIEGVCIEYQPEDNGVAKYRMADDHEFKIIREVENNLKCLMGIKNISRESKFTQKEYYHKRGVDIHREFNYILSSFEGFEIRLDCEQLHKLRHSITLDINYDTLKNDLNRSIITKNKENCELHRKELRDLFYRRIIKSLESKVDKIYHEVEIKKSEWVEKGFGEMPLYFHEDQYLNCDYIKSCEIILRELLEIENT